MTMIETIWLKSNMRTRQRGYSLLSNYRLKDIHQNDSIEMWFIFAMHERCWRTPANANAFCIFVRNVHEAITIVHHLINMYSERVKAYHVCALPNKWISNIGTSGHTHTDRQRCELRSGEWRNCVTNRNAFGQIEIIIKVNIYNMYNYTCTIVRYGAMQYFHDRIHMVVCQVVHNNISMELELEA